MTPDLLRHLLVQPEGERLEFKEWKRRSDVDALARYCCALANEGGGYLVIGVTDRRPRKVVGTSVFEALEATTARVNEQLHVTVVSTPSRVAVTAAQLQVDGQRVVVFSVPSRAPGEPVLYRGALYCRQGESLVVMPPDRLGAILDEGSVEPMVAGPDARVTLTLDGATTPPDFLRHYRRVAHEHGLPARLFDRRSLTAVDGRLALTPSVRLYLPRLLEVGLVRRDECGPSVGYQLTAREPVSGTRSARSG